MSFDIVVEKFKRLITYVLLIGMAVVVASATIELIYTLILNLIEPPGLMLGLGELHEVFGLFLLVLIAIELMSSVHVYLIDESLHLEVMFLVAITAVIRKVLIVDPETMDSMYLIGIALLVASLAWGYVYTKESTESGQD